MFRIEPNLIKAIALVESNLKKDSIGKNRDKNNNIKSLDYWLMQINQMHIPLLKKRGIIKDERDLWICPYISRHLLSLNPLLACCRRYSRGER